VFCSTVLTLEVFVVLFAALVAFGLRTPETSVGAIWAVAGGVALLCVVAAGLVRRPIGLWLGSFVQLVLLGGGFVVPMMWFIGVVFTVVWVVAIMLGSKIDVERAERAAAEDRLRS
jgi:hypothetical protein